MTTLYHVHAWCPRCDKTANVLAPVGPKPRILCHTCLRDDDKVVEMRIIVAEVTAPQTR